MKKIFISTMLAAGILQTASAQRFSPALGLELGLARGSFHNPFYTENNSKSNSSWNPNVGIKIEYYNKAKSDLYFGFGLQTKRNHFDYRSKYELAYGSPLFVTSSVLKLDYVQLPLYVGYRFNMKKWSPFINIGIAPSLLGKYNQFDSLRESDNRLLIESFNVSIFSGSQDRRSSITEDRVFKSFNLFASAKVGAQYNFNSKMRLPFAINYERGLFNIENQKAKILAQGVFMPTYYDLRRGEGDETFISIYDPQNGSSKSMMIKSNPCKTQVSSLNFQVGFFIDIVGK